MISTKQCSKCKEIKSFDLFTVVKGKPGSWCKACKAKTDKEFRDGHKDVLKIKQQIYYEKNKDAINEYKHEWYEENKEAILLDRKTYYEEHTEEVLQNNAKWRHDNIDKKREQDRKYNAEHKQEKKEYDHNYRIENKAILNEKDKIRKNEKRKTDIQFKLQSILRRRLSNAIHGKKKVGSAVRDLGCSVSELRQYLEQQFHINTKTGEVMSWENYGAAWQIDHVTPLCYFDLTERRQFLLACNYINLQPLWVEEHIEKTKEDIKKLRESQSNA